MIEKFYNWILKQKFLVDFVVLGKNKTKYLSDGNPSFQSFDFKDGQWNEYFEWDVEKKEYQNWNTYRYLRLQGPVKGFAQQYGRFNFWCKLDGEIGLQYPAIWLLDIKDRDTISDAHYLECDVELDAIHFWFTIWITNGSKNQDDGDVWRANYYNPWLYYLLRNEFHLYTIDWTPKRIKYYVDGLLAARFSNAPHYPLAITLTKLTMKQTLVERN